jgi:ribonucleotide monophosphatase NagD (HAD superfamily)
MALLGLPRERLLAVGDSLRTDIAGAAAAGLASCWVLGGLHGAALGNSHQAVEKAARNAGLSPVASIPRFSW